jgi:hypothetical protein
MKMDLPPSSSGKWRKSTIVGFSEKANLLPEDGNRTILRIVVLFF